MYCVFCGKSLDGEKLSAAPVKEGSCCEGCYKEFVEPAVAELPYKYGVLIPADPEKEVVPYEIKNKGTLLELNDLQAAVGGHIQVVRVSPDSNFLVIVDEEGRLSGKPHNERATSLVKNMLTEIVGDALVVKEAGENFGYLTLKSARLFAMIMNSEHIPSEKKEEDMLQKEEPHTPREKTAEKLREGAILALNEKMFLKRFDFIQSITDVDAFTKQNVIIASLVKALFYQNEYGLNAFVLRSFGVELTEEEIAYIDAPFRSEESEAFCRTLTDDMIKTPESAVRALMLYTYALWWDNSSKGVWGELGEDEYSLTEEVKLLYIFLASLGYKESEEEVLWYNGTHDVYKPVEVENNDGVSAVSG